LLKEKLLVIEKKLFLNVLLPNEEVVEQPPPAKEPPKPVMRGR